MKRIARWARGFGVARAVCILLLLALVPLRIADPLPIEELRLRTFDLFQVMRPREQKMRPVVIADIDEASLKEIGQWPWPRTVIADLVTKLRNAGAVAVGFDVLFAEPDRTSPAVAADSFRGLDAETREKLAALPNNDMVLAEAIKNAGVVVVGQAGAAARVRATMRELAPNRVRRPRPGSAAVSGHFPGLLRNMPSIETGRRRARNVFDRSGTRRHRAPRAGRDGGAGPIGAGVDHGNAAGRQPRPAQF